MDFSLSETQRLLDEAVGRLLRERYAFDQRRKLLAAGDGAIWAEFAALGLLGIEIPETEGGSGGGFEDLSVVLQAFGRALVVEPYLPTVVLGAGLVAELGSASQRQAILPGVAAGTIKLALAHGEPAARYDLAHVATRARRDGDFYVLDGAKSVVLGGDQADWLLVSARTAGGPADSEGISLFLLTPGLPGVELRPFTMLDDRGAAEIALSGVRVAETARLGPVGGALPAIERAYDRGVAALACEAVGAMGALNALTLEYLKTRNQFGRPIGKFQALQHRMVDMTIAEEQARAIALLGVDQVGNPDPAARRRALSAVKVQIGRSAQAVGRGAIQLHGGIGMTEEYAAGHYFRRLTAIDLLFGDVDHHLARFAAAG